jgi:hypothetical protein
MPEYGRTQKQDRGAIETQKNTLTAAGPVEIGFVLDKSSSMHRLQKECVAGLNVLLEEQQKLISDARLSMLLFSDELETVYDAEVVSGVRQLEPADYRPEGNTALLDGIGRMIERVGRRFDMGRVPPRVLIAILTDGDENSSTVYSLEQIKELINYRRLQDNWQFIFMTAGASGVRFGLSIGIQRSNIIQFDADPEGIEKIMLKLSAGMKAFQLGDRAFALKLKN